MCEAVRVVRDMARNAEIVIHRMESEISEIVATLLVTGFITKTLISLSASLSFFMPNFLSSHLFATRIQMQPITVKVQSSTSKNILFSATICF